MRKALVFISAFALVLVAGVAVAFMTTPGNDAAADKPEAIEEPADTSTTFHEKEEPQKEEPQKEEPIEEPKDEENHEEEPPKQEEPKDESHDEEPPKEDRTSLARALNLRARIKFENNQMDAAFSDVKRAISRDIS